MSKSDITSQISFNEVKGQGRAGPDKSLDYLVMINLVPHKSLLKQSIEEGLLKTLGCFCPECLRKVLTGDSRSHCRFCEV